MRKKSEIIFGGVSGGTSWECSGGISRRVAWLIFGGIQGKNPEEVSLKNPSRDF